MKLVCCVLGLVFLLTGCGVAPAWETVEDTLPAVPVLSWQEEAYTVQVGLPQQVTLQEEADGCRLFSTDQGDFEIETHVFLTSGLDQAVRQLSGYEREELSILEMTRFDLPEYQFAWYTQTEQGGRLSRADLILDGQYAYAVVCSSLETAGDTYEEESRAVFASFGLYQDEGV